FVRKKSERLLPELCDNNADQTRHRRRGKGITSALVRASRERSPTLMCMPRVFDLLIDRHRDCRQESQRLRGVCNIVFNIGGMSRTQWIDDAKNSRRFTIRPPFARQ